MEQFSHDLTLALEETSRSVRASVGRWGMRRRTRSTGNLPCAPLPTEDSSSSPADPPNSNGHNESNIISNNHHHSFQNHLQDNENNANAIQSDSDDRQAFAFKLRSQTLTGNFESDSLNENFSPTRPNTRRKRKFKRMAVEYETTTTPSTPHTTNSPILPIGGTIKKRVLKHTCQENFRANIFFCGKRKRSHRERYLDNESHKHSSSVPRQRDFFTNKSLSYLEYRNRTKCLNKSCEKILPLNKSIVSKIEKISQDTKNKLTFHFPYPDNIENTLTNVVPNKLENLMKNSHQSMEENQVNSKISQKSGSFESALSLQDSLKVSQSTKNSLSGRKHKHSRRRGLQMQQFDDQNFMDCGNLNDFLSSSSLSSSDSEAVLTNESDHEGDDELTDWPGNEAMINFASKNDFKRAKPRNKSVLQQIKQDDIVQDEDTLIMSTDEILPGHDIYEKTSNSLNILRSNIDLPLTTTNTISLPIDIAGTSRSVYQYTNQIESEMSGETSNHLLSSPNNLYEIREILAGCRRIREERPGFSIISSANEDLSRFLQDERQVELKLFNVQEQDKLIDLAKLYSLNIEIKNGLITLTKTSNTMQSIKIDQTKFSKHFLSDYKRRCYGDADDTDQNEMIN